MTDEDLIRLLAEKSPREWTEDEVRQLRYRLRHSAALREEVQRVLQLETELSSAFGPINVSVDRLLLELQQPSRRRRTRRTVPWWWALIGLSACLLVGAWFARRGLERNPQEPAPDVAEAMPTAVDPVAEHEIEKPPASVPAVAAADLPMPEVTPEVTSTAPSPPIPPPARPPAAPASPPAPPEGPWSSWLAADARPLPMDDPQMLGDLRSMGLDQLTLIDFQEWWATVSGLPSGMIQEQVGGRPVVKLDGWSRLQAPWLPDTHLRMTPFDLRRFTLYLWHGSEGIALKYYREREPHVWAAFRVQRQPGEKTPNRWGLLTTDSGAAYRSNATTCDVTLHDGQLLLSIGGIVILTTPMAELPDEVLLEAETCLRGFRWVRAEPPPRIERPLRPNVLATSPPADFDWQTEPAEAAMLQRDADGGLTLTSTSKTDVVRAFLPLSDPGLYETLVRVATADPGTGVYLGNASGQPLGHLTFCRDRQTKQLTYVAVPPGDRRDEADYDFRSFPPPYFVDGQWLRIVAGLGVWHTCCSGDGRHWGHVAESPLRNVSGAVRSVGLYCLPSETPRTIKLQAIEVRRLDGFDPLANAVPAAELPPVDTTAIRTIDHWLSHGWDHPNETTAVAAWRDAWAVETLKHGPTPELAGELIGRLVNSASRRLEPEQRWRLLDDVLSLTDHWQDDRSRHWEAEYAAVGYDQAPGQTPAPSLEAWQRWITSPCWSHRGHRGAFYELWRDELLRNAYQDDWGDVYEAARREQMWLQPAHPDQSPRDVAEVASRVVQWSRALAADALGSAAPDVENVLRIAWRHPLLMQLNKEAYNVHAELQSALGGEAYADACRIVAALDPQAIGGLLPDSADPSLLVSLDVALRTAAQASPMFAARLSSDLGPTGDLRVRAAAADGDVAAMEAATMQFWGTPPAARAQAWLGDRALSLGDVIAAVMHYRRSALTADDSLRKTVVPRLRLAEAQLGLPVAVPQELAPAGDPAVDQLAAELITLASAVPRVAAQESVRPPSIDSRRYRLETLARFDGQGGQNAGRGEYRNADAFGRQFAVALDDQHVYLHNRFQVTAYDRQTGNPKWAQGLGNEQGEAHAFPFISMTPVVSGDRLLVRRLTKSGVDLACLMTETGKVEWTTRLPEKSHVISDAYALGEFVWALVAVSGEQAQWDIQWTRFDRSTGAIQNAATIVRLRDAWNDQLPAAITVSDLEIVAALGGVVAAFDLEGRVHWLRREVWLPPMVDPLSENLFVRPPVLDGDRVYVAAPNTRRVLCLDLVTGRTRWSAALPDLQGLLLVQNGVVLAAEPDHLVALSADDGAVRWRRAIEHRLDVATLARGSIFTLRQLERKGGRGWLQLVELDAANGTIRAEIPWDVPEGDDWRVGPWWSVGQDAWALIGQGYKDAHRDLVRLTPLETTHSGPWRDPGLGVWSPTLSPEIARDVQWVLPGWQLFGVPNDKIRREANEVRGERDLLVTRCDGKTSLRFVRTVPMSTVREGRLQLRVGCEPNESWRLQVIANGSSLLDELIQSDPEQGTWRTLTVPMTTTNAAETVWQIVAEPVEQRSFTAYWKELAVEPADERGGEPR